MADTTNVTKTTRNNGQTATIKLTFDTDQSIQKGMKTSEPIPSCSRSETRRVKRELCKEALVRELYITRVQTMWLGVPDNQNEHTHNALEQKITLQTSCLHHDGCHDRSPSVISVDHAGYDTTLAATQVGRRWVDEATTTVFREFGERVKPHRFCHKNGDDWHGQNWAPSVFHRAFIIEKDSCFPGDSKTIDHRPSMTSIYVRRRGMNHVPMVASSRQCHDVSAKVMRWDTYQTECD